MSTDAASRITATKIILFIICFFNIDNYLIEMGLFIKTVLLDIYCFLMQTYIQKLVQNYGKYILSSFLMLFI